MKITSLSRDLPRFRTHSQAHIEDTIADIEPGVTITVPLPSASTHDIRHGIAATISAPNRSRLAKP